jgi:hypothetical protein
MEFIVKTTYQKEKRVNSILEIITQSILELQDYGEEPVLLSNLGSLLKKRGFDYKEYGHDKLIYLLKDLGDSLKIECSCENPDSPPIYSVSLKSRPVTKNHNSTSGITHQREKSLLYTWAYLGDLDHFFEELSTMALPEVWSFANSSKNSILKNYLEYTFIKLKLENKIVDVGDYASFNTGLVDKLYRPIFALFSKNKRDTQPYGGGEWMFKSFCVRGQGDGKILSRNFQTIPKKALYLNFDRYQEFIYDTRTDQPELDTDHIIIDNLPRLPRKMLEECVSSYNSLENFEFSNGVIDYASLKEVVKQNIQLQKRLYEKLKSAVDDSFSKVSYDYRIAIPIYYRANDSISMLLPLAVADEKINLALVCEWQPKAERYQAHTIFSLDMAYRCARLINRLDGTWLSPDKISLFKPNEDEFFVDE